MGPFSHSIIPTLPQLLLLLPPLFQDVDQLIILLCTRNMHHLHQLFSTRVSADEMVASLPEESQPFIRSLCSAVLNYYDFSAQQFYISIALIDEAMQNSSSSSGLMASRMNLSDSNNNNDNKCFDLLNRLVAEHYRDVDRFMEIAKAYESRYMTSLRDAVLHVLKPGWYREFMSVLLL